MQTDNAASFEWIEESLRYAHDGGSSRLIGLLEMVLVEMLFEIECAEGIVLDGRENGEG
jgi:hypothetical protein